VYPLSVRFGFALACWLSLVPSLALSGCGEEPAPNRCIDPPSFNDDVFPLIQLQCLDCHAANKVGPERNGAPDALNYDTFESAEPAFDAMVSAITSGRMPPPEAQRIGTTTAEREAIGRWQQCGYPRTKNL
jgi:uncharacterized membrane protein